jgi:hypothetical protein
VVAMPHRTTCNDPRKIYRILLRRLRARLAALGERIFATTDAHARQHGWQVTTMHGGLGRRYRDHRFDVLAACPDCHGCGVQAPASPCRRCKGTGRIMLGPSRQPTRGLE